MHWGKTGNNQHRGSELTPEQECLVLNLSSGPAELCGIEQVT